MTKLYRKNNFETEHYKLLLCNILFIFIIDILLYKDCIGQKSIEIQSVKVGESFLKLPDGVIKKEIASFNLKASSGTDSFPKIKVNEMPLRYCSEGGVAFSKRGRRIFIHTENFDTIGHRLIYDDSQRRHLILIDESSYWGTGGDLPKRKIKDIVQEHMAWAKYLPDSAFKGLYEPNFCIKANGKKATASCKVFLSEDRRRLYIYMLGGNGAGSYEATLVLQNGHYYTRVIDSR